MNSELGLTHGRAVELDEHGHLADRDDWSRLVAESMAAEDGIVLGEAHWQVMTLLAAHYDRYSVEMPMRLLVKRMRETGFAECASSRALYKLFPEGPVRQGSRYAGLPIPLSCI